jgi:hypothetical protein
MEADHYYLLLFVNGSKVLLLPETPGIMFDFAEEE